MSSSVTPPPDTPTPPTRAVEQLVNALFARDLSSSRDVSTVLTLLAELERHAATRAARLVVADLLALRLDMEPAAHVLHVALERTLERIVAAMHVADLLALDRQLRPSPWKVPVKRSPWDPARSAAVQRLAGSTPSAVVCGLLASHPSGYVREAVVDQLRARWVEALPWLLVRSVDWVAPVQARASRGVEELLTAAASTDLLGAALVAALPLANRLPGFTRVRAAPLTESVQALLLGPWSHALRAGLAHDAADVRAAAFDLLLAHGRLDAQHLELALRHGPARVRVLAARQLGAVAGQTPVELCKHAFAHGTGAVRALALAAWASAELHSALPTLRVAIDDADARVRSTARSHLTKAQGPTDFAAHYRAQLATADLPLGAVAGLGEVGDSSDWERLVPALDATTKRARAAIRALRVLDKHATRELRLMMVDDPRPGVSVEATRSVVQELREGDTATVAEYLASPRGHTRRNAVALCGRLPGWAPVIMLLELTDPALTGRVRAQLGLALRKRRSALPATPDERERLRALTPKAAQLLGRDPRELARFFEFMLGPA